METNEVAIREDGQLTIATPADTIKQAQQIANILMPIIEKQNLFTQIGKKKHVWVEGWTTMLAMLTVFPEIEFVRNLNREGEIAYEARVILKTAQGRVIGSAESMCSNKESSKAAWAEYAVKSMAQTRAVGKAARLSFSWIMCMAGYAATPAEEMETDSQPISPSQIQRSTAPIQNGEPLAIMKTEIKEWLGIICQDNHIKMETMIKEITTWPIKDKQTGVPTGVVGSLTLNQVMNLKEEKKDWLKRIHSKVASHYESMFQVGQ